MATLRPATEADIPAIAALDLAANPDHPVTIIPWAKPSDAPPLFLSHHQFYWRNPYYHYVVATIDENIVGFILWEEWVDPKTKEEFEFPPFPEGTDTAFFDYFVGQWVEEVNKFDQTGCYEMEALAVPPEHRRKGIGAKLVKHLTDLLDENKAGCFLRGSKMGKPLYEKAGWKVQSEWDSDFSKWGWHKEYRSWYMQRDAAS